MNCLGVNKIIMCTDIEERIEHLEYMLYFDYDLEYHMKIFRKPSEIRDFYKKANEELKELYRQKENEAKKKELEYKKAR